jgi:isopentenyl-diphosphate delta-isomerase
MVVLLDEAAAPIGQADKVAVHGPNTPLHLAFSCYIFDPAGHVLMTRRALDKRTWPGVWTNSCCGHPSPGEDPENAVRRRATVELGLQLTELHPALPGFRYRAADAAGIVENEICPVYWARTAGTPALEPTEVAECAWADWAAVVGLAESAPWALSPWSVLQILQLNPRLPEFLRR